MISFLKQLLYSIFMFMVRFGTYPDFKTFIKIHINVNCLAFTHLKTK